MLNACSILRVSAVLALALAKPVADVPKFVCKDGVTIRRTLEMKGSRELTRLSTRAGDENRDTDDFHMAIALDQKWVVEDEVKECSAERVTKLARTFVTLEKSRTDTRSGAVESKTELPETSDLADKTVAFAWDSEKKAYKRTIDGQEVPELTADLEADMNYLPLLPPKDAEAGAKWDVDFADAKTALLHPGGELHFHGPTELQTMDKRLRDLAWSSMKGKLSLELGQPRDEDGRSVVTISFHGDYGYVADVAREGEEKGPEKLHAEDAQKVEGKLEWDLQAGRALSIAWTGKGEMKLKINGTGKMPDGSESEFEQSLSFDEEYTYTGAFEAK